MFYAKMLTIMNAEPAIINTELLGFYTMKDREQFIEENKDNSSILSFEKITSAQRRKLKTIHIGSASFKDGRYNIFRFFIVNQG